MIAESSAADGWSYFANAVVDARKLRTAETAAARGTLGAVRRNTREASAIDMLSAKRERESWGVRRAPSGGARSGRGVEEKKVGRIGDGRQLAPNSGE